MTDLWPFAVLVGVLVLFGAYLAVVLRQEGDLERPPEPVRDALARRRTDAVRRWRAGADEAPAPEPAAPPTDDRPRIRPAEGTVATSSFSSGISGRDELLGVLATGPDYRRRSAARALSVPFAGTRDPTVVAALADAVRNEEVGFTVRAEAYCALRAVMGQHLEPKDEVEVRRGFPAGADLDWVEAAERDACATPTT